MHKVRLEQRWLVDIREVVENGGIESRSLLERKIIGRRKRSILDRFGSRRVEQGGWSLRSKLLTTADPPHRIRKPEPQNLDLLHYCYIYIYI
jgi:hypothetical protein